MKQIRTMLPTIVLLILCGGVLLVFWLDRTPKTLPSADPTDDTDSLVLYMVGDAVDWNGYLTFQAEALSYSRAVPQGLTVADMLWLSDVTADDSGTLTEHTYVDITAQITCKQLLPAVFGYDAPQKGERVPVELAVANQNVNLYDTTVHRVIAAPELRAFQCLTDGYEIDHHGTVRMEVGDSIRVRLIYIVKDSALETPELLLLFTPQYGFFSNDHMTRMGYTQPHILLKGEPT